MGEIAALIKLIEGPTGLTVVFVAASLLGTFYLQKRKVDVESATSTTKSHIDQVTALMNQNRALAEDLAALREATKKLHEEIDRMRETIRELRDQLASKGPYESSGS